MNSKNKIQPNNRTRARLEILNYITAFCTNKYYEAESYSMGDKRHSFHSNGTPPIGSLILLQCALFSKWYLSWLHSDKDGVYLLESIEDGTLCNWRNVMVSWLPKELTDKKEHWRWTDEQYEFNDRWMKLGRHDYTYRPMYTKFFNDDGSAKVTIRQRFTDKITERLVPSWKKMKVRDMRTVYSEMSKTDNT